MASNRIDARTGPGWRSEFPHLAYLAGVAADYGWTFFIMVIAMIMAELTDSPPWAVPTIIALTAYFRTMRNERKLDGMKAAADREASR